MTGRPPALVAVAHGSRDPRSAAAITELGDVVRRLRPELDVAVSFLDLSLPRLEPVLAAAHEYGHREVVLVPLLLGDAFHARVDVPNMVRRVTEAYPRLRVRVADVLGGDARVGAAALDRLASVAGDLRDPELGVLLAGAGSARPSANDAVTARADDWASRYGWAGARAVFATGPPGSVGAAVAELRAHGARRVAMARWFLAPGLLADRVAEAARAVDPDCPVAEPTGAHPLLAQLVLDRYEQTRVTGLGPARRAAG